MGPGDRKCVCQGEGPKRCDSVLPFADEKEDPRGLGISEGTQRVKFRAMKVHGRHRTQTSSTNGRETKYVRSSRPETEETLTSLHFGLPLRREGVEHVTQLIVFTTVPLLLNTRS